MGIVTFDDFKTIVIPCPAIAADSVILLTVQSITGPTVSGAVVVSRIPGVSFTVRSGRSGDVMTVGWAVLN